MRFRTNDEERTTNDDLITTGVTKKKEERHAVDALASSAEEGRGQLRKASGSCNRALIRRSPNGATPHPVRGETMH
jgi:hypothetical protein